MITLTMNPALDLTLHLAGPAKTGALNRSVSSSVTHGGKGTNFSLALLSAGVPSAAVALLGGAAGERFRAMHEERGLKITAVPISAETRTNVKVIDGDGVCTEFNQTVTVTESELDDVIAVLDALVATGEHKIMHMAGSLPAGAPKSFYRTLCERYGDRVACIVDADGEALKAAVAAKIPPVLLKPNKAELEGLVGRPLTNESVVEAAREVRAATGGRASVIVTLGENGAVFVGANGGGTVRVSAVKVPVVRGFTAAGDTFLATFVARVLRDNGGEGAVVPARGLQVRGDAGASAAMRAAARAAAEKVALEGSEIPANISLDI
jgi:1-phosphofructokinase